jgi:hypothetical protein
MDGLYAASLMREIVMREDKSTFALTEFYTLARRLSATDPRDHIFALLDLLRLGKGEGMIPELLRPDYRKSAVEVLRDATRYVLTEEIEGEEILGYICHRTDEDMTAGGKPSWSLSWNRRWDVAEDFSRFLSQSKAGVPLDANEDADVALVIADTKDMDVLTLSGFKVAIITWLTPAMTQSIMSDYKNVRLITKGILGASKKSLISIPRPNSNKYSLTADLLTAGSLTGRSDSFHEIEERTAAFKAFLKHVKTSNYLPRLPVHGFEDPKPVKASAGKFYQRFNQTVGNRCFFMTNTGHLGHGPKIVREGDVLVVFKGATCPSILRAVKDEYRLIGGAYVPGLMRGEVFTTGLQSEWFDIR